MIFISCSFDDYGKQLAHWVRDTFKNSGINAHLSGQLEAQSLPQSIRGHITASEAMLVIITGRHSAWVHDEIGIAYAAEVRIYALVQEYTLDSAGRRKKVKVEGILPYITIYEIFDAYTPQTIIPAIERFIEKIKRSRKVKWIAGGAAIGALLTLLILSQKKS